MIQSLILVGIVEICPGGISIIDQLGTFGTIFLYFDELWKYEFPFGDQ